MDESQPTQQATQSILDPRRLGKQNSGFTDEDIADIICLLIPYSPKARSEAAGMANEGSPFVVGREEADNVNVDYAQEDHAANFGLSADTGSGPVFLLRLSAAVRSPLQGFIFGRNPNRCDICFTSDSLRRLSNTHFRIFINEYGVLMLQDQSTNGTAVDEVLLRCQREGIPNMRTLHSGSKISILLQDNENDLAFLVRVPRREGEYQRAYQHNVRRYLDHINNLVNMGAQENATPTPNPADRVGHVNLFPPVGAQPQTPNNGVNGGVNNGLNNGAKHGNNNGQRNNGMPPPRLNNPNPPMDESLPREWDGSGQYNRVGQIGKGAFATVYKVTAKFDGRPYAAKELDKRRFIKNGVLDQKVDNEMRIMQNVQHPNIVSYIEHFDFEDRLFIIIMEYVSGGDLGSYISDYGALPESAVKSLARQLLDALGYLHHKNITHRDVKPDNILIESKAPFTVKLTDFGLSKMVDNEQTFLRTFCGTLLYCAPEVYTEYNDYDEFGHRSSRNRRSRRTPGQRYDHAIDIWSLGGVLFYCLTGNPPFPARQGTSYTELLHRIMTSPLDINPLMSVGVSPEGIDFLSQMLQRRPEYRATVETLQNHPWLAGSAMSSSQISSSDDALEQSASQLSIRDEYTDHQRTIRAHQQPLDAIQSDDEILDDEDDLIGADSQMQDLVPDYDYANSEKENIESSDDEAHHIRARRPQPRLFGEVAVSAIGSSGVIPEDQLNLPLSDSGSQDNQNDNFSVPRSPPAIFDPDETFLTPAEQRRPEQQAVMSQHSHSQQKSQNYQSSQAKSANGGASVPRGLSGSNFLEESQSVDDLNNLTFDVESQSLSGAESILGNLNMKSLGATSHLKLSATDLTSSKRKPALDTSDEFDGAPHLDKPTIKRLKSETQMQSVVHGNQGLAASNPLAVSVPAADDTTSDDPLDDPELFAAVQPITRSKTGRDIDLPLPKSVYWIGGEEATWHLQYPEMTQMQYGVFLHAAKARHEEFCEGGSKLWDLAMKHFPPSTEAARSESRSRSRSASHMSDTVPASTTGKLAADDEGKENNGEMFKENIVPPQQPFAVHTQSAIQSRDLSTTSQLPQPAHTQPAGLPQQAPIVIPVILPNGNRLFHSAMKDEPKVVARLDSTARSVVSSVAVPITKSFTSWGRAPDNTHFYGSRDEVKVPKYAFKIVVWRSGEGADRGSEPWVQLQPWSKSDAEDEIARHYYFYISTKARSGILINRTDLRSVDPANAKSPPRRWIRLHDGDSVIVWNNFNDRSADKQCTELTFRCSWGGSAKPRDSASPATLMDEQMSRHLDYACSRAERSVAQTAVQERCLQKSGEDVQERKLRINEERHRSVVFEQKRAAILARWQQHHQLQQDRQLHSATAPPALGTVNNTASARSQFPKPTNRLGRC